MNPLKTLLRNFASIPGWKTDRKLILFVVDDYGSIRMSSKSAFSALEKSGINLGSNRYNRYETIESNSDLGLLFEVLTKYKDKNGNHPVFTPLVCVANPDFDKIRSADFQEYFYEPFTETLKKYPEHDRVYELWKQGIEQKIFLPQFHGREHLNIKRWMADLKAGVKSTHLAFDQRLFGIGPLDASDIKMEYQAAFDLDSTEDLLAQEGILIDGLALFEKVTGYKATYFTPANALFSHRLELTLKRQGINMVNVGKFDHEPLGNGKYRYAFHYLGQRNKSGQRYIVRNALFEPNEPVHFSWVDRCLKDIELAFRWHKPAIISSHRVNFCGYLDPEYRAKGLLQLDTLLDAIIRNWPEAEFVTTNTLFETSQSD